MESIIVAVLVGVIVGGVSTWFTHNFDRWRRREIREEDRHRNLREMLETMMRLARAQASGLAEYEIAMIEDAVTGARELHNLEATRVRNLDYIRKVEERYPSFFWRPWRIDDDSLRQLAYELQDANTGAGMLMYDLLKGNIRTADEWTARSQKASARIETTLKQVDERLDELGW